MAGGKRGKEADGVNREGEAKGRIKNFNNKKFLNDSRFVVLLIGQMMMPLIEMGKDKTVWWF